MKTLAKLGILSLLISGILAFAAPALAASPYLSITSVGNNLAQVSISNANPYSGISLYEQQNSSLWTVINNFGTTNGSGSYNQQTSLGNGNGNTVNAYVVVAGLQSNTVTFYPNNSGGCTYNCGGGLSLSQTSVSLAVGQTSSVSVQNSSGSVYVSNNSNQSVVSATASYNSVSLYGLAAGSATLTICSNSYSQCATLYVTVSGSGSGNGTVTFSQSNINLSLNQNTTVYVYGATGSNSFYVSNNSNNSSVIASLSGNVLTLTGYNAGSSTLTVCQSNGGGCGSLYVTVGGGSNTGSGVTFSQNNLVLTSGQTSTVYVYGYGGYYVSSNSSGSIASASINGNVLTITALSAGNTIFTVCQNNNNTCGSLSVAVSGNNNCSYGYAYNCGGNNSISFSQNNISLSANQSQTVTVYGNAPFYISSNSNSGAITASVSGNIITLYGYSSGSSSFSVCSSNSGGCGTLYVTVNGYNNCSYGYSYNCGSTGTVSLSQTSVSVAVGQTVAVSVYGNGPFVLNSNGYSSVASGVMSGNTLNIYGSQPGTATITVCQQNYSSSCASVTVNVSGNNTCTYNCGSVLGSSVYANGQLLDIGGTVYIVYQNTLTAFSSSSVFLGLGFSFGNVINVGYQSGLTISSYVISTTAGAHPWGSWVKNGAAVYFVSQQGLVPVPDWNTFLNNGGSASLIVSANAWDFQLPLLSPMAYNDSRVR